MWSFLCLLSIVFLSVFSRRFSYHLHRSGTNIINCSRIFLLCKAGIADAKEPLEEGFQLIDDRLLLLRTATTTEA